MGAISRITKLVVAPTFLAWLAGGAPAPAADTTLSWWHGDCGYNVGFNPATHDEARLRNTVRLIYGPPDFKAPLIGLPHNPQSVARINLEHFRQECRSALDVAGRLEFIELAGVEDYRRALMDEISDTCAFESARIRGLRDPAALRDYQPAAACTPFVDALEGKRDVKAAFQQTLDHQCAGADQSACIERELARVQKDDGGEWMRLYLVSFGWNACAAEFTARRADGRKLEQMRADLEAEFQRTFNVTRNICEASADGQPELRSVPAALAGIAPGQTAAPGKPVSPPGSAGKPRHPGCSMRPMRRSEAEKALCAAGHGVRLAAHKLPAPLFAADRSKQNLSYGRR